MYNKEKSPEFIAQMYRDKSGGNNPQAKSTIVIDTSDNSTYTFNTFKEAASFLGGRVANIRHARDNGLLYKDRWLIQSTLKSFK